MTTLARPEVNIRYQVGAESVHGTPVAASKRFQDLSFDFGPEFAMQFARAAGHKYITAGVKNREWSVGQWKSDALGYNSLAYILSGLFGHGIVAQIGVTGGYTWPIAPNGAVADDYISYTLKQGDDDAADSVPFGAFVSGDFQFAEDKVTASGNLLGQAVDTGATMDATPTAIAEAPISVSTIDWYIDPTSGAAGTTKWTDVLRAQWKVPPLRVPAFRQNTASPSLYDLVEIPLEQSQLVIVANYNSQTRGFVNAQRANNLPVNYVRKKIVGPNIGVSADFKWQTDFAVKLEACKPLRAGQQQSIYAYEFTYRLVDDPSLGGPLVSSLVNKLSGL